MALPRRTRDRLSTGLWFVLFAGAVILVIPIVYANSDVGRELAIILTFAALVYGGISRARVVAILLVAAAVLAVGTISTVERDGLLGWSIVLALVVGIAATGLGGVVGARLRARRFGTA